MSKETKEIARDIVTRWKADIGKVVKYERMIADIDRALQDERKRPVKIVGAALKRLDTLNACCAEPMRAVWKAIRNGVADAK